MNPAYAFAAVEIAAVLVVMTRIVCLASKMSMLTWQGGKARFIFYTLAIAMIAGGAVGTLFNYPAGPLMLLVGLAGQMLFDRRC